MTHAAMVESDRQISKAKDEHKRPRSSQISWRQSADCVSLG
jgi:hypothetical protein